MFFLAIILNFFSSYLIASIFRSVLIIFISFFAFGILSVELLSLFSAINAANITILSLIYFLFSIFLFKIKKGCFLLPSFDFKRFKNALWLDKSLIILLIAFCFLILISFYLSYIMPALEPDSQTYHFFRSYMFYKNQTLAHFETNDIRAIIMPINSEVFYTYLMTFKNNFRGYAILSFFSYILALFSMWDIFEKFKYCYRKRLYAIFILSSLSAVIVQMSSLQSDILVGSLLLSALALFIKKNIYFSSLSLSLVLGIKTTAFGAVFSFFVLSILYEILIEKNKKLNSIKLLIIYLIPNFLVFSSYNYILNIIQFHNPFSNHAAYLGHKFWGGIKGYIANLIHFFFQSIDFTGFKWGYYLNDKILSAKNILFHFIHINQLHGSNVSWEKVNIIADEQIIGFGILGFLVYLPCVFYSTFKIFFNKNKKTVLCFLFAITFLLNILLLARSVAYMVYSIRFIVAFVIFSSPVLVCVYKKKSFIKPVILFFCLYYMLLLSSHIQRMPLYIISHGLKKNGFNLNKFEDACYRGKIIPVYNIASTIKDRIKIRYSNKKNIAFIKTLASSALYLKKLEKESYRIDFLTGGNLNYEKLKKYDLIILENKTQNDNIFNPKDININYRVEGQKVIFNNSNELNCFYTYTDNKSEYIDYKDAIERECFTYQYMLKNPDFREDFREDIKLKEFENNINIYYFVKNLR